MGTNTQQQMRWQWLSFVVLFIGAVNQVVASSCSVTSTTYLTSDWSSSTGWFANIPTAPATGGFTAAVSTCSALSGVAMDGWTFGPGNVSCCYFPIGSNDAYIGCDSKQSMWYRCCHKYSRTIAWFTIVIIKWLYHSRQSHIC
jgi:hypothetical protein